jgi:hypothetical protein
VDYHWNELKMIIIDVIDEVSRFEWDLPQRLIDKRLMPLGSGTFWCCISRARAMTRATVGMDAL